MCVKIDIPEAVSMRQNGASMKQVCDHFGIAHSTLISNYKKVGYDHMTVDVKKFNNHYTKNYITKKSDHCKKKFMISNSSVMKKVGYSKEFRNLRVEPGDEIEVEIRVLHRARAYD